jgi:hypothetical protein
MATRLPETLARALSIRQPYCDQIFRGTKHCEYRSRRTRIRGRVYIYAGLKPGDDLAGYESVHGILPKGLIVGSVEIIDCRVSSCYDDTWDWVLSNPKRYRTALAVTNQPQPSFWFPRFA